MKKQFDKPVEISPDDSEQSPDLVGAIATYLIGYFDAQGLDVSPENLKAAAEAVESHMYDAIPNIVHEFAIEGHEEDTQDSRKSGWYFTHGEYVRKELRGKKVEIVSDLPEVDGFYNIELKEDAGQFKTGMPLSVFKSLLEEVKPHG